MAHRLRSIRLVVLLTAAGMCGLSGVRAGDAAAPAAAAPATPAAPVVKGDIDDAVVVSLMEFIEVLSQEGYFDLAAKEYERSRAFPGLTDAQRSFLDLTKAKLNVGEILKTPDLAARDKRLAETRDMLLKVIASLPTGTDLRDEALMRVSSTYFDVANGYVKEIDGIDENLRNKKAADAYIAEMRARGAVNADGQVEGVSVSELGGQGNEGDLAARRTALAAGASKIFADGEKLALELHERWLSAFENMRDNFAYVENRRTKDQYMAELEGIFVKRLRLEFTIGAMYYDFARLFPRGSEDRIKVARKGIGFVMDIREAHKELLPEYLADSMNDMRLCGLLDDPILEKRADWQKEKNPWPTERMEIVFNQEVIGKHKDRAHPEADKQEQRARIMYLYAEALISSLEGAYAQLDKETDEAKKKAWADQANKLQNETEKYLAELQKDNCVVGPIPAELQFRALLNLNVRFELLMARRLKLEGKEEDMLDRLSAAKSDCDNMILNPDPAWAYAGKKYLLVTTAVIRELAPGKDLPKTPGDAIATAERFYKTYTQQKDAGASMDKLRPLLEQVADNYRDCIRLLERRKGLTKDMRARFIPKSWYYIGLSNFYMGRYYESFIANDQLLQEFHPVQYPADKYPEVQAWTDRASKNIIASADKQRTASGGKDDFDRKMYAWAMIRRAMRESVGGTGQNKDLMIAIGKQFDDISEFELAFVYYSQVEADSQYFTLSYLMRGQAALKLMQGVDRDIKVLERAVAKSKSARAVEDLAQKKATMVRWRARAEEAANKYVELALARKKEYATTKPPAGLEDILKQEDEAMYGAYLLLVQTRFTSSDWESCIKNARDFAKVTIPASVKDEARQQLKSLVSWMEFVSTINLEDEAKGDIAKIEANLATAEGIQKEITKSADAESVFVSQSIMLLGGRWYNLSNRIKALENAAAEGEKAKLHEQYIKYQLKSGEWFKEAKQIVAVNINFGLMVGDIFTRQEKFEDAEEVYDLVIKHWDIKEKYPPMPEVDEFNEAVRQLGIQYQVGVEVRKRDELVPLHEKLRENVYSEQPNYPNALSIITRIRGIDTKIPTSGKVMPTEDVIKRLEAAVKYSDNILSAKRDLARSKMSLNKWDAALTYVDDLLKVYQKDANFKILKAEILCARARKASAAERDAFFKQATQVLGDLLKLNRTSDQYWQALTSYLEIQAEDVLSMPKDQQAAAAEKGSKTIKTIKLWIKSKDAGERFKQDAAKIIAKLEAAGYSEAQLSPEKIAELAKYAEARAKAEARDAELVAEKIRKDQQFEEDRQINYVKQAKAENDQKKIEEFKVEIMKFYRGKAARDGRDEAWVKAQYDACMVRTGLK